MMDCSVWTLPACKTQLVELQGRATELQAQGLGIAVIHHFEPLNERVPVFQQAFTLSREVVLDGQSSTQRALRGQESLRITGTLRQGQGDVQQIERRPWVGRPAKERPWPQLMKAFFEGRSVQQ